jgi:hypothetical protein
MIALLCFFLRLLASPFKPLSRLEAENAALRRQLIALQRKVRGRVEFTNSDRLFFVLLYRWFPSVLKAITIIRPETLVRWHRAGFRRYWRWKSRNPRGRPPIHPQLRTLIRQMSIENVIWGAPRIQGELLKLGFAIAQSTVAKDMAQNGAPSGQRWSTFGSPWQNGYAERLIGTIRRECLDHLIVFGESHLRRILGEFAAYYNKLRVHRSLDLDAPLHRAIESIGIVASRPILGALHHQYRRI